VKILVVDDSNFARRSLIKLLNQQMEGWEVIDTGRSEEAFELFSQHKPLIVFLDLTMPMVSGEDVLRQIREVDTVAKVIVVTADIQHKTRENVLGLGADMLVNKPIDADKMAEIITGVLS
jgi:two-component system chemotaxis response regulator CheY